MTKQSKVSLPLTGIRIADFSRVVAGPYGGYLLARMGAEVVKIEGTNPLDHTREVGPYTDASNSRNRSGYFNSVNGAKKSVTLHLQDPAQAALAKEIALSSDVVIESFMSGTMERFGLGFDLLMAEKPALVMVSCSGFGRTGPMANHSAYMNTVAAFIGLTSLNTESDGPPMPVGATFSDLVAGTAMAFASLLALKQAKTTGRGTHVDLSMAEVSMSLMAEAYISHFSGTSEIREPLSSTTEKFRGIYPTKGGDKWIAISLRDDADWSRLVEFVGNKAWAKDYPTSEVRRTHKAEIDGWIAGWTRNHDNVDLTEKLQAAGIPALPSSDAEDVVRNPHFLARGAMAPQDYVLEPGRIMPNLPWQFDAHPELSASVPPPPTLGQHNREVLHGLSGIPDGLLDHIESAVNLVINSR